jgi:hypothetical protein
MMTGPEHYTSAEQHLDWAEESDAGSKPEKFNLAAAQVHATLALAAATAISRLGAELSMPPVPRVLRPVPRERRAA